jgi:hypothetical protein
MLKNLFGAGAGADRNSNLRLRTARVGAGAERNIFGSATLKDNNLHNYP